MQQWGGFREDLDAPLPSPAPPTDWFSVADLFARPEHKLHDHLAHVPKSEQIDFLIATFYTALIDQVIYAHFQHVYPAFRRLTLYPKMDRSIGHSRTMILMANPYEVFSHEVLDPRSVPVRDVKTRFEHWVKFIIADLKQIFDAEEVGIGWPSVCRALLQDGDCIFGPPFGPLFEEALAEECRRLEQTSTRDML
ncbi:MAG: hypothetical protein WKF92_09780 [Pyrinomonadaceae bacterium]